LYADCVPELPEVETIARGLDKRVTGDAFESVWIGSRKQPLKSPAAVIASTLEGRRIVRVHRAGKHIVFDLEGTARPTKDGPGTRGKTRRAASLQKDPLATAQWIVHLGMTGRLVVSEPAAEIVKHTHLIAKLASGRELRFIDPRMFGKLSVHAGGFDPGGVEPLEVSEEAFLDLFRGRKTPIKSALLNQKLLRGVGNIYAAPASALAGAQPRSRGSDCASCIWRCKWYCVRQSRSADRRFPITWMPTEKRDFSSSSIECMAVKASRAWCAEQRSGVSC
jgi:formamidopyrimidine-DNA glycosylase